MRRLTYIPIIHEVAEEFKERRKESMSPQKYFRRQENEGLIREIWWELISEHLEGRKFDALYVESFFDDAKYFPLPEKEPIGRGEHDTMRRVQYHGARLEKTENPTLHLLDTHYVLKPSTKLIGRPARKLLLEVAQLNLEDGGDDPEDPDEVKDLEEFLTDEDIIQPMELRDRFIAWQINRSLREGEHGILFLGAAHNPDTYLDRYPDVIVDKFEHALYNEAREALKDAALFHQLPDYATSK